MDPSSIGGLCTALELEGDWLSLVDHDLAQTFLTEVGQLRSVEDRGSRVRLVGLDLHGMVKEDMESVTGSIRVELLRVVCQDLAAVLELDPDGVVGGPAARAVHTEPNYEYSSVHTKLNTVTPTPVPPLVRSKCKIIEVV